MLLTDFDDAMPAIPIDTNGIHQVVLNITNNAIDAVVRYLVPIHLQPAFADCGWQRGQFPVVGLNSKLDTNSGLMCSIIEVSNSQACPTNLWSPSSVSRIQASAADQ